MRTQCLHCRTNFQVSEENKGKEAKCPKCKQLFIITPIENTSPGNVHPKTTKPTPEEMPIEEESKDIGDESHEKLHKSLYLPLYLIVGIFLICYGIFGIVKFEVKDKKGLVRTIKGFSSPAFSTIDSSGRIIHHDAIISPDGVLVEPGLSRMRAGAIPPVVAGLLLLICSFKGFRLSGWNFIFAFMSAILIGAACGCPFAPPAAPPDYFVTVMGNVTLQATRLTSFLLDLGIIRLGVPLNVSIWLSVSAVTLILLIPGIYFLYESQLED